MYPLLAMAAIEPTNDDFHKEENRVDDQQRDNARLTFHCDLTLSRGGGMSFLDENSGLNLSGDTENNGGTLVRANTVGPLR